MIVVPAFAKREQRHPPAVGGEIAVTKRREPQLCVAEFTQPGRVQANDGAHEDAPHQKREVRQQRAALHRAQSWERNDIS